MSVWVTPIGILGPLSRRSGLVPEFDYIPPNTEPRAIHVADFSFSCHVPGMWKGGKKGEGFIQLSEIKANDTEGASIKTKATKGRTRKM